MGHDPWQGIQGDNHEMQVFQPTGGDTYRSGPQGPSMRGMGMGMNREVFRSAPRGPIMGNDVFRSAPMARGAVPVYRGSNDQYRGGRQEKWRGNRETFRSALTGPQMIPNRMPMSSPASGEVFRNGKQMRSAMGIQTIGHGPVMGNKQGLGQNYSEKDNYNLTKEQMDKWNAVNNNSTMGGDADDMDDSEALAGDGTTAPGLPLRGPKTAMARCKSSGLPETHGRLQEKRTQDEG